MPVLFIEFLVADSRADGLLLLNSGVIGTDAGSSNSDKDIFRVVYDDANNGETGRVYRNFKRDYPTKSYVTITLDGKFYDFCVANLYNPLYQNIDLRVAYYLTVVNNTQYKIKHIRPTKYEFSRAGICLHYDTPDPTVGHVRRACTNHPVMMGYCPEHLAQNSNNL